MSARCGWVAVLLSLLFAVAGCGDDDGARREPDGGAELDGGAEDDASTRDAGDAGSLVDAGRDGAIDPMCTPLSELPPLPAETVSVASACSLPSTCDGDVEGRWSVSDACIPRDALFPQLLGVCSTATFSVSSSHVTGSVRLQNGQMTQAVTYEVEALARLPNNCSFCRCDDMESALRSAGIDASCVSQCTPDCTCFLHATGSSEVSASYSVEGSTLTTNDGRSFETCASDASLALREIGGSDDGLVMSLVPQVDGPTPERCDGRDNDDNGTVDDEPIDCPPCDTDGVCNGAATAHCVGGAWQCSYIAATYEATEAACDRLDNDCDGVVDEGPLCGPELCDGVDNDADGTIDDAPTDPAPACSVLGVCSAGGAPVCRNGAWTCDYVSASWEAIETQCDTLDNDCNGETDEPLACCVPLECDDVNADCGMIDNGCQAMTDCGGCDGNAWCGAVSAHQCACLPQVSEPPHSPTVGDNDGSIGTTAWNGTSAIFAPDYNGDPIFNSGEAETDALTEGETTNWLIARGFGFALPPAAVITGVTVEIKRRASSSGGLIDHALRLVTASGIGTTDRADATEWSDVNTVATYGGASDTWGGGLTPAIVNDPAFGVALSARYINVSGNNRAQVDHVTVAIDYTVSCP